MAFNKKAFIRNIYDLLLPLLALGIFFNLTSAVLCFALILFRAIFIGKGELAVYLLLFGTGFLGLIFNAFSMPIPGAAVAIFIGVLFIWDKVILIFKKHSKSFLFLLLIFMVFVLSYLYGPKTEYSQEKLGSIFYTGILALIVFIFYVRNANISNRDIAQLLLLTSIAYYAISLDFFNYRSPQGLFDFVFFRASTVELKSFGESAIGYHTPALLSMYGLAFLLSADGKFKPSWIYMTLFIITSLLAVLISGARQGIIGFLIIIIVSLFLNVKMNKKALIIIALALIVSFFSAISFIDSDYLKIMIEAESLQGALNRNYERAFDIMKEKPLLGVGLGGYPDPAYGKHLYPHNIFLEILSEAGIIGLILCLLVVIKRVKNINIFNYKTANNSKYFLIFTAFAIRTMISEDLGANIVFFSLIFAMVYKANYSANSTATT
jgi:O-antigen ligase